MKKQNPLILNIPNPCKESWAEMSVVERGRFCSHCQKTVTDITAMSDTQIVQLFQKQTDTHCIRAFTSQLNRPITLPPQAPTRFYRIAVALGLVLITAGASEVYARPRAPLTEQNYLLGTGDSPGNTSGDSVKISGLVLDETGASFSGAVVKLTLNNKFITGTMTDDNGSFVLTSIPNLPKGAFYLLEFKQLWYLTNKIILNENELMSEKPLIINMTLDETMKNLDRFTEIRFVMGRMPLGNTINSSIDSSRTAGTDKPILQELNSGHTSNPSLNNTNNKRYNNKDLKKLGY